MNNSEASPVSLAEKLHVVEEAVRREPTVAHHRWMLFQWLCIDRQWARAVQQLCAWAQLDMGRSTCWRETGRTGVLISGRKTWTTDAGEFDLFELGECVFDHVPFPGSEAGTASSGAVS